jgi:diaminopimelate epimerase
MGPPELEGEAELHGFRFLLVSMGNPHAVAFLWSEGEVEALDLRAVGPKIENDPRFPDKTNVEFA